jgi:hypothetical protein
MSFVPPNAPRLIIGPWQPLIGDSFRLLFGVPSTYSLPEQSVSQLGN